MFVAISTAAIATLTSCAAGQHAQTAEERPTIDGYYGDVGRLTLGGVALAAPTGNTWPHGSTVPMSLYVANTSGQADKLVNVSSPSFTGWQITSGSALSAAASTSGSAGPSSSSGPLQGGSGSPQPIPAGGVLSLGQAQVNHATGTGSGKVLLLTGLKGQLWPGAQVTVVLTFQHAGTKRMRVPVQITTTAASESVAGTNTSGAAGING